MRFHLEDLRIAKATGKSYGSFQIPDEALNEEVRLANMDVHSLAGLVMDDDLRREVGDVQHSLNVIGLRQVPIANAEAAMQHAVGALTAAQERIAARLRELYRGRV